MDRRTFFLAPLVFAAGPTRAQVQYPAVERGVALAFPRDHGSHPAFRTEWWYITGWVRDARERDFGVQITFFRVRPGVAEHSASRFAPTQLLFAHAAIADPVLGRLRHDQRAARAGFELAQAAEHTTDVAIGDWSLRLAGDTYAANVVARDFAFALTFTAREPPLLQGEAGVSRKGPADAQASFYYSRPHLSTRGTLTLGSEVVPVTGTSWLDHEWSSEILATGVRGWDWTGINLDDGGALMAFVLRGKDGTDYWAGGTLRSATGVQRILTPREVRFMPLRHWRSPRTGASYPVAMRVHAGEMTLELAPLIDDQELDSRSSVGAIYWEGAVRATSGGRPAGRGYLELTGYAGALKI
jgi:predicted secreted hydrolase